MFSLNKNKLTQQFALMFLSYDYFFWNYIEQTNYFELGELTFSLQPKAISVTTYLISGSLETSV